MLVGYSVYRVSCASGRKRNDECRESDGWDYCCHSYVAIPVKNSRLNYRIPCMAAIFGSKHMLLEVASGEAVVGKKFVLCAPCHTLLVDGAGCSFSSVAPMGRPHAG